MSRKLGTLSSWSQLSSQPHLGLSSSASSSYLSPYHERHLLSKSRRKHTKTQRKEQPDFRDNIRWPAAKAPSTDFTPYSIFNLEKGAQYSKARFYELVKVYHPDRHHHEQNARNKPMTQREGLERYRLIILAHQILSDPVKKQAYDKDGTGWITRTENRHSQGYRCEKTGKMYGRGEGYDESPFANATWEDWERWYARNSEQEAKKPHEGNFMDPNVFAFLVLMTAVTLGVAQATNAGSSRDSVEERARAFTAETTRFLENRVKAQKDNTSDSDGRIKWFLNKRDPTQSGLDENEQGIYKERFSPQAVGVVGRGDRSKSAG